MPKKPFTFSIREDSIRITFDKAGWTPRDTKLLEHYAERVNDGDMPASEPIKEGLGLYSHARDGNDSHVRFMEMLDIDVKNDPTLK